LLYYHFVAKSGIDFDVIKLLEKLKKRVPTFAGIKFTDNNLGQVAVAIDKFGEEMVVGNGHCPLGHSTWSISDDFG
jgi:dihydrodipicolinate synthase/N-acetylneuraminate lyase